MGPVSASVMIDAPRERVFELLCDLANRPALVPSLVCDLRLTTQRSTGRGAGARFRVVPLDSYADTVIVAAEEPHTIREEGHGGRLNRVAMHVVWELSEGPVPATSEVALHLWTEPMNVFDRLRELRAGRRARRAIKRSLAELREVVEAGGEVRRVVVAGGPRIPH